MKFSGKVTLNKDGFQKLLGELAKSGKARVQVGVLSDRVARNDEGEFNNADLGAVHELGSKSAGIPARSFLQTPCVVNLPDQLAKVENKLVKLLATDGLETVLKNVGVMAENTVDEAFVTSGGGSWPPNKQATLRTKTAHIKSKAKRAKAMANDKPLIDTGKLRRSITSRVIMGGAKE